MDKLLITIIAVFLIGGGVYFVFHDALINRSGENFFTCAMKGQTVNGYRCCGDLVRVNVSTPVSQYLCQQVLDESICIPCGNGICDSSENTCTCREDCQKSIKEISSFEECAAAGNAVMESYPRPANGEARPAGRQCNTPDGKHFVENIGNANEMSDLIAVNSPRPNETVKSPLTITGKARGTWYFEASFPVKIVDANGVELGSITAQAQSDWMTENFVPFTATIEFSKPANPNGTIILKNDNPSGDPANDKQLTIPIKF